MMKAASSSIVLFLAFAALAAEEIDVAKEALRDGFWEVARSHAAKSASPDAPEVILESYAREEKWDELAKALEKLGADAASHDDATPNVEEARKDAFLYYKALALAGMGEKREAAAVLDNAKLTSPRYRNLGSSLRARLAAEAGDGELAIQLIRASGFEMADAETKITAAGVFASSGDMKRAQKLWREVAADTNASERAFALAAINLEDLSLLRRAVEKSKDAETRRLAGLRLARLLIKTGATFDEGASIIRKISRDAPDTAGASEAAIALADALLAREAWSEAADAFGNVQEIWPEAAKSFTVQEGRGWALAKLGKPEEALEAFARAAESAADDAQRAMALLEQGDVLSGCGKGTEAMAKYRQVLDKYPSTSAAVKLKEVVKKRELEAKGRELYNDYRFFDAQKVFAQLAEIDPKGADRAHFLEVLCLYGQGLDNEAEAKARAIANSSKDSGVRAEATLWLAKLAYNARRWLESGELFTAYADMASDSPRAPGAMLWAARAAFAENDFAKAVRIVTRLMERYPDSKEKHAAYVVQGEALIEQGRFDEAILVLERAAIDAGTLDAAAKMQAEVLKADALFALGADNPARYLEALDAYRAVRAGESLNAGLRLAISFKIGRTLEKLKRIDEAIDQYYTGVVIAYREGRQRGEAFDDEARAAFARAAFRLVDEFEARGKDFQAMHILELVIASDIPASSEAEKRLDRIQTKGKFL